MRSRARNNFPVAPGGPAGVTAARRPAPRPVLQRLGTAWLSLLNRGVPKRRGKIVLHGVPDLEDGVIAVLEELLRRGRSPIVLVHDWRSGARLREILRRRVTAVPKHSLAAVAHFLTAQFVFTTHGLFGSRRPPSGQLVVNLWHGEPPCKIVARFEDQPAPKSSIAPVMSTVGRAYRCAEFGLRPSAVPIIGAPRNDRMLRADPVTARRRLLGTRGGVAFIWLPTYRATNPGPYARVDTSGGDAGVPFDDIALAAIDAWLGQVGATVILKLHPLTPLRRFAAFNNLRVITDADLKDLGVTVYEALSAIDCLITDISSVWIDFLLLDKPILFAFPDIEAYRLGRGINLEPYEAWVPGPLIRTAAELIQHMSRVASGADDSAELRNAMLSRFHAHQDSHSAGRLLDLIGLPTGVDQQAHDDPRKPVERR